MKLLRWGQLTCVQWLDSAELELGMIWLMLLSRGLNQVWEDASRGM